MTNGMANRGGEAEVPDRELVPHPVTRGRRPMGAAPGTGHGHHCRAAQ
jgi:hypothetical protein